MQIMPSTGVSSGSESKPSDSDTISKTFLVCLGERKREVTVTGGSNKHEALRCAVVEKFSDVLEGNENFIL